MRLLLGQTDVRYSSGGGKGGAGVGADSARTGKQLPELTLSVRQGEGQVLLQYKILQTHMLWRILVALQAAGHCGKQMDQMKT